MSTVYLSPGMEKSTGSNKVHKLGTRGETPDGRAFRYAVNSAAALEAGRVIQAAAQPNDGEWDMDLAIESTHASGSASIGSRDVPVLATGTLTSALSADEYADGWLHINDGPGEGHIYAISSHPTMTTVNSTVLIVTLGYDDEVASTNLTTASLVGLIASPYNAPVVIDLDTTLTQIVGVSPAAIPASEYFWAQTWGASSVLTYDDPVVPTVGKVVVPMISTSDLSGGISGPSTVFTSDAAEPDRDLPSIGIAMSVASVTTDFQAVWLTIAP